jgi:hypothetical protein
VNGTSVIDKIRVCSWPIAVCCGEQETVHCWQSALLFLARKRRSPLRSLFFVPVLAATLMGCGLEQNCEQTGVCSRPILDVLISRGACSNYQDCQQKEMVLGDEGTFENSPVYLNMYNVSFLRQLKLSFMLHG